MPLRGRYLRRQGIFALPDDEAAPCAADQLCAMICCQPVFPVPIPDGANDALKMRPHKRDIRNSGHYAAFFRKIIALNPRIAFRKRPSAVLFSVADSAAQVHCLAVYMDRSREPVMEADDAMTALHGEETEKTHYVAGKRCQFRISDPAVKDLAALTNVQPYALWREYAASNFDVSSPLALG